MQILYWTAARFWSWCTRGCWNLSPSTTSGFLIQWGTSSERQYNVRGSTSSIQCLCPIDQRMFESSWWLLAQHCWHGLHKIQKLTSSHLELTTSCQFWIETRSFKSQATTTTRNEAISRRFGSQFYNFTSKFNIGGSDCIGHPGILQHLQELHPNLLRYEPLRGGLNSIKYISDGWVTVLIVNWVSHYVSTSLSFAQNLWFSLLGIHYKALCWWPVNSYNVWRD